MSMSLHMRIRELKFDGIQELCYGNDISLVFHLNFMDIFPCPQRERSVIRPLEG